MKRSAGILAGAALAILATAVAGATRSATMEPTEGPPGTLVHVSVTDTGPHAPERDLVMTPCALGTCYVDQCITAATVYPLGVITWSGILGTGDFVVPDVGVGVYYIEEVLPEVTPPCMPVGTFTVSTLDTAMAHPGLSLITLLGLVLIGLGGAWTFSRWRRPAISR